MAEQILRPKQRRWLRYVLIATSLLIAGFIAWQIWFYDYGVGEYKDSPDGRYTADLMRFYERTLLEGEIEYVRASVVEKATEKTIWSLDYRPANTSTLYNYGVRGLTFIRWNAASDEVVFPLDQSGKEIVVPMP